VRGYFYWVIGRAYFFKEDYPQAIDWLRRSVREWPDVWYNRAYIISAQAMAGRQATAQRALAAFNRRFPGYTLRQVMLDEEANPSGHRSVGEGRDRFHEGLSRAGMPA